MRTQAGQQVVDFLERHVIGHTVAAQPITARTNGGRTEITYVDQNFFSNLSQTPDGFGFDLTAVTLGRRYGLDEQGRRVELAGSLDAVRVYRYELTERPSTGQLLGFARFVSSTNTEFDPFSGACFLSRMRLAGEELIVQDMQVGYGDFVDRGGVRRPIAVDGVYRYTVKDGRLIVQFDQGTFNVDPETLTRTPTGDQFPTQVSEEFDEPDTTDVKITSAR